MKNFEMNILFTLALAGAIYSPVFFRSQTAVADVGDSNVILNGSTTARNTGINNGTNTGIGNGSSNSRSPTVVTPTAGQGTKADAERCKTNLKDKTQWSDPFKSGSDSIFEVCGTGSDYEAAKAPDSASSWGWNKVKKKSCIMPAEQTKRNDSMCSSSNNNNSNSSTTSSSKSTSSSNSDANKDTKNKSNSDSNNNDSDRRENTKTNK